MNTFYSFFLFSYLKNYHGLLNLFKLYPFIYIIAMKISCNISEKIFRDFTIFNILKRLKYWKSPVIFASILTLSAIICFVMKTVDGAVLLGSVLLIVGLGVPAVYFISFFLSLNKQVKMQNLNPPRCAYTIDILDKDDGIFLSNEKELVTYRYKQVYHIYLTKECLYLFMTPQRAFLLPYNDMKDYMDNVIFILEKRTKNKITDLRK